MTMFLEDFTSIEDVKEQYQLSDESLENVEILYAAYQTGAYDGQSIVLFKRHEKLYIVDASHCSCYGLDGQWDPVETTEEALKREVDAKSSYCYSNFQSFIEFCKGYFQWK